MLGLFSPKPCCTLPMARVYRKYEEYNIVQRTELLISYYVVSAQSFWTLLFNKLSKTKTKTNETDNCEKAIRCEDNEHNYSVYLRLA